MMNSIHLNSYSQNKQAEHFYKVFQFLYGHDLERISNKLILRFKIPQVIMNMNGSVQGRAFDTILSNTTTIPFYEEIENLSRTLGIELGLSFISPAILNNYLIVHKSLKKQVKMLHTQFVINMKNEE
ncbi:unnamed protein product [Paramecium octaurelia]|uniref:Uncharacterized protein n=1 Tax=Paramecium octaurelia TaxID=43137 RepID=A0A8S1VII2_PAROT|nr:unnamed protein product [Paramecium octaurelia]